MHIEPKYKTLFAILISTVCLLSVLVLPSWATSFVYDEMNRLTETHFDDGTVLEYKYDKVGNITDKTFGFFMSTTVIGGGAISPATAVVIPGASQTFTISPLWCYSIATVTVDDRSLGVITSYSLNNVIANHTINAAFTGIQYNINKLPGAGGSIYSNLLNTDNPEKVWCGYETILNIVPNTGYHISTVTVDGKSQSPVPVYVFNKVLADHTIAATFDIDQYAVTPTVGLGGKISPTVAIINYGANQTFTFTPDPGYSVNSVIVDSAPQGAITSYTLNSVTGTHTLSATFYPLSLVRNVRSNLTYPTIQSAYNAAFTGDVLQLQAQSFTENLVADLPISITIDGGYTSDFSSNTSTTNIIGVPHISSGSVNLKNIHIHN